MAGVSNLIYEDSASKNKALGKTVLFVRICVIRISK
jgi:hypothetical protein